MKQISPYIFRGYDIRGVYPNDINEEVAYQIGKAFGSKVILQNQTSCVIGHDNRLSSPSLEEALIKGILETGVSVVRLGLCTTPMYYFACLKENIPAGIMITASHNPKDENGFKMALLKGENLKGEEIQEFYRFVMKENFQEGVGQIRDLDIKDAYYEAIMKGLSFGNRKVKVVIDCGNGTTSPFARELYEQFPIELITLYDESDGTFPNHHPDPSIEENLKDLKAKVLKTHADVGLSFDGDGDRVGVITNKGRFLPMDQYMILMIRSIMKEKPKNNGFLFDIKCSNALSDEIKKLGGKPIEFRTGNSYTKKGVSDLDLPFGGEFSGHIYFRDRFLGFDSGLYAGLRLVEVLSKTKESVEELLEGIEKYIETPEIKIPTADAIKFQVIDAFEEACKQREYHYHTIDGVKVLFSDGFASVRASNTGPNITARFEARDEKTLEERKSMFLSLLEEIKTKLDK